MPKYEWENSFDSALESRNVRELLNILQGLSTAHGKTPKTAVKNKAVTMIQKALRNQTEARYNVAVALADSGDDTGQELAAHLLAELYSHNPDEVSRYLHMIADSENWEVREWAAGACGSVLVSEFDLFYNTMKDWVADESPNVRRAVVVAVKYAAKDLENTYADSLITLIEPLLADRDPYVRKNLGAFAIGDGLLKYYPEPLITRLFVWGKSADEQTKWNTAMVFTAAAAGKHKTTGMELLETLLNDQSAYVQRAALKAKKLLDKRTT